MLSHSNPVASAGGTYLRAVLAPAGVPSRNAGPGRGTVPSKPTGAVTSPMSDLADPNEESPGSLGSEPPAHMACVSSSYVNCHIRVQASTRSGGAIPSPIRSRHLFRALARSNVRRFTAGVCRTALDSASAPAVWWADKSGRS